MIFLYPNSAYGVSLSETLKVNSNIHVEDKKDNSQNTLLDSKSKLLTDLANQSKALIQDIYAKYSNYLTESEVNILELSNQMIDISIWEQDALQKILENCQVIYARCEEQAIQEQKEKELAEKVQRVSFAAYNTSSPGYGLCAAWITNVISNAGLGTPHGNANDMYYAYCFSANISEAKAGMVIAVPTHNLTALGRIYGHIGILVSHEDGLYVRDNIGYIREEPIDVWIDEYNDIATPQWGYAF